MYAGFQMDLRMFVASLVAPILQLGLYRTDGGSEDRNTNICGYALFVGYAIIPFHYVQTYFRDNVTFLSIYSIFKVHTFSFHVQSTKVKFKILHGKLDLIKGRNTENKMFM